MGKLIKGPPVGQYFLDYRADPATGVAIFQARNIESGIAVLESKSISAVRDFIEADYSRQEQVKMLMQKHQVSLDILAR